MSSLVPSPQQEASWLLHLAAQEKLVQENHGVKMQFANKFHVRKKRTGGVYKNIHRPKINHMLGVFQAQKSCSLGVPPAKLPKKLVARPRARSSGPDDLSAIVEHFVYDQCVLQQTNVPIIRLQDIKRKREHVVGLVEEKDQYDYLETELNLHNGKLKPLGCTPGLTPGFRGKIEFQPFRIPHAWVYLFKRGFEFQQPGPDVKTTVPVTYNLDYLRSASFFVCFFRKKNLFDFFVFVRMLRSRRGTEGIMKFFDENVLRVRGDVLFLLARQVFDLEGNGEKRRVLENLPQSGEFLSKEHSLVLSAKGLAVLREEEVSPGIKKKKINPLKVTCMHLIGIHNFGWSDDKVVDCFEVAEKAGIQAVVPRAQIVGVKAAPARSFKEVFRWAWSAFRLQHPGKQLFIPKNIVALIEKAKSRPSATPFAEQKEEKVKQVIEYFKSEETWKRAFEHDLNQAVNFVSRQPKKSCLPQTTQVPLPVEYITCSLDATDILHQETSYTSNGYLLLAPDKYKIPTTFTITHEKPTHCTNLHQQALFIQKALQGYQMYLCSNLSQQQQISSATSSTNKQLEGTSSSSTKQNETKQQTEQTKPKLTNFYKCTFTKDHPVHDDNNYKQKFFVSQWLSYQEKQPCEKTTSLPSCCTHEHQQLLNKSANFQRHMNRERSFD